MFKKKSLLYLVEAYNSSPAFAILVISFAISFLLQAARVFVGHYDSDKIKLLKIAAAIIFISWALYYNNKQKHVG